LGCSKSISKASCARAAMRRRSREGPAERVRPQVLAAPRVHAGDENPWPGAPVFLDFLLALPHATVARGRQMVPSPHRREITENIHGADVLDRAGRQGNTPTAGEVAGTRRVPRSQQITGGCRELAAGFGRIVTRSSLRAGRTPLRGEAMGIGPSWLRLCPGRGRGDAAWVVRSVARRQAGHRIQKGVGVHRSNTWRRSWRAWEPWRSGSMLVRVMRPDPQRIAVKPPQISCCESSCAVGRRPPGRKMSTESNVDWAVSYGICDVRTDSGGIGSSRLRSFDASCRVRTRSASQRRSKRGIAPQRF
jgi:hypothetical protein